MGDWEGAVQHGLRELADCVQSGQGLGQADAGCGSQQEADNQPDLGSLLDDIKEPTNYKPLETGLSSLESCCYGHFSCPA